MWGFCFIAKRFVGRVLGAKYCVVYLQIICIRNYSINYIIFIFKLLHLKVSDLFNSHMRFVPQFSFINYFYSHTFLSSSYFSNSDLTIALSVTGMHLGWESAVSQQNLKLLHLVLAKFRLILIEFFSTHNVKTF